VGLEKVCKKRVEIDIEKYGIETELIFEDRMETVRKEKLANGSETLSHQLQSLLDGI